MKIENKIKKQVSKLWMMMLENSWNKVEYTDMELADATIIWIDVMLSKTMDFHKDKLTEEQMQQLAVELWASIHQTVKIFAWVDMKELMKK